MVGTYVGLCVDPAGAAWSDSAAGRSDSPAAGPAGSAPADHHPAATDCYHSWTEPGLKVTQIHMQMHLAIIFLTTYVCFCPCLFSRRGSRSVCRVNR